MMIWRWIKDRLRISNTFRGALGGGGYDADSDSVVTLERADNLSAWLAARRLITETVASLPCGVYEKKGDEREARQDHRVYELLAASPNDFQTPVEFWEGRVGPLCTLGNSYAEKRFIGDRLVMLQPMPAEDVTPQRNKNTNKVEYKFVDRGKDETLPAEKVFHIRGFGGDDGLVGLSPIEYAARSLGGALAAERIAGRVYSRGLRASGYWKSPVDMDKSQRRQFDENYVKPMSGVQGQGKSVVMPPGIEWVNMNITPHDAELLMTRAFNVADVCRWMGVPPILVGHSQEGQTMWGSGVEQIILGWLALGLRAYLRRIEAAVNLRLFAPEERGRFKFEFAIEGLLRADSAARAQLMSTLSQNGLRDRDELRKLDNLPPLANGQGKLVTVQSNLVTLDQLAKGQQGGSAEAIRNAMRSWLGVVDAEGNIKNPKERTAA